MNELKYELAKPEMAAEILEFLLTYFREDEPISRSLGMTRENGYRLFEELVQEGLCSQQPVSFVCLNQANQIIACRLNKICDLSDKKTDKEESAAAESRHQNVADGAPGHFSGGGQQTDVAEKIESFLDALCSGMEKLLPDCRRYMKFIIVSVHPDYQRRGIAKKLIELSMEKARQLSCDYIITAATAYNSQQMFDKLNFETLRVIEHKDFRQNGVQVFQCDDRTTCGKLMVKKLA